MINRLLGMFSIDLGIDLGTCNTLVCVKGEGIVLNEPSVVAVYTGTNKVAQGGDAVGQTAKDMIGKTPQQLTAVRPLKDGVISDFEVTEAMLSYFIRKVQPRRYLIRPRVVISVPSGITAVERRAVEESAQNAGARRVFLVDEPMAAAIGAGLPTQEPTASMIVDIGGGTSEVALISLGGISTSESIRVAGDDFDDAIISHMRRTYNLAIGEPMAEQIKIKIGSAAPFPGDEEPAMDVRGRDMISGLPRKVAINAGEIREALQEPVNAIIDAVKRVLERAEPMLAADLVENGVTMAGGSSMLRGLTDVLSYNTGLAVRLADDPLTCVARGTNIYLENLDDWKGNLASDSDGD